MDLGDPMSLFSGMLISCIGLGFLIYGKKAARLWPLAGGLALCIYPYFMSSVLWMWLLCIAIVAGIWAMREK